MNWLVSLPDRLDSFLFSQKAFLSRTKAQEAIEKKMVLVNGVVTTKSSQRLQEGDTVSLVSAGKNALSPLLNGDPSPLEPKDLHFRLLYEDKSCCVIDKPAGIAVHPGSGMAPGEITILHGVAFLYQKWGLPFREQSVLVHRLDKETTGCLLIAKNPEAHLALQKQFETRTVRKTYLALVAGIPEHPQATIDSPIGRSARDRTVMSVTGVGAVREAQTTYRVIGNQELRIRNKENPHSQFLIPNSRTVSLLECNLHTGRTHQIRVHLSSIGHPVLGDGSYTSALSERLGQEYAITNLCLHAWKLSFTSPANGKKQDIVAPLPREFSAVMERVGIDAKNLF